MDLSYKSYYNEDGRYISIPEFYDGKSVFITEATTFIGRLFIEKLLRSCPGIENIYVLIRPEKGESIQEIVDEVVLKSPIFDKLREARPNDLKKVVPIKGDMTMRFFGVTLEDFELLKDKVSVILHSSFLYRPKESLKTAVKNNLLPTKELIKMCHFMKKLDALVYISTVASYWHQKNVHEVTYPPPYEPDTVISMTKTLSDELLAKIEPLMFADIKPRATPNTFTFTKALSEAVVIKDGAGIPRTIVRPSMVISCLNEPLKGYIDNWTAPSRYVSIIGRGLKRSMYADKKIVLDLVPADLVVNMTLAAAWNVATHKYPYVPVFNISTGMINPITTNEMLSKLIPQFVRKYPLDGTVWYPSTTLHNNRKVDRIHFALTHYLPAYIYDYCNKIRGEEGRMVETLSLIRNQYRDIDWMLTYPQQFHSKNPQKLMNMMSESDRKNFPFDVRAINWKECIEDFIFGVRKYLCNQDDSHEALLRGRKRIARLKLFDRLTKVSAVAITVLIVGGVVKKCRKEKNSAHESI